MRSRLYAAPARPEDPEQALGAPRDAWCGVVELFGAAYNAAMNTLLLLCTLCAAAVEPCVFTGTAPEGTPTFRITNAAGEEDWAAVRTGDVWAQSVAEITAFRGGIRLTFDTPWSPRAEAQETASRWQFVYETPVVRKERLLKGWQAAGYTFIDSAQGCWPVLQSELALAERARALTREETPVAISTSVDLPPPASAGNGTPASPGFLQQWGMHLGILALGAVLLAVVGKTLILGE